MIFFGHIGITLLFAAIIFTAFREKIDYRFLIAGAILPDLIDKPIGHYIFADAFHNGRIFGHTVLFVLVLATLAFYAERKYRFTGIGVLALGAILHQAEDQMWMAPSTSLWPALGWQFPKLDVQEYTGYIFDKLLHDPNAYVPEIAGLAIVAWFVWRYRLFRPENVMAFLRTGTAAPNEKKVAA